MDNRPWVTKISTYGGMEIPLTPPMVNAHVAYQAVKKPSIISCMLAEVTLVRLYLSQSAFTFVMRSARSRRNTVEEISELSHPSAISDLYQSSQVIMRVFRGTVKSLPLAKHTLFGLG